MCEVPNVMCDVSLSCDVQVTCVVIWFGCAVM